MTHLCLQLGLGLERGEHQVRKVPRVQLLLCELAADLLDRVVAHVVDWVLCESSARREQRARTPASSASSPA